MVGPAHDKKSLGCKEGIGLGNRRHVQPRFGVHLQQALPMYRLLQRIIRHRARNLSPGQVVSDGRGPAGWPDVSRRA